MYERTSSAGFAHERLFALGPCEPFKRNGKAKRHRPTRDVVGAACRLTRAAGERLAHGDGDLFLLLELEQELHRAWVVAVAGVREHGAMNGASRNGSRP